jgi:hypothetical protein
MAEEEGGQAKEIRLRRAVGNAYGQLVGGQNVQSFMSFTLEDALDLQIEQIEGEGTDVRPNLLNRLTLVEQEVVKAVEEIKALPANAFRRADESRDVNTPQRTA